MPKFTFQGAYPRYYPLSGLFAKRGETHDLDAAPDADWVPADGSVSRDTHLAPATAPVAPVAAPEPVPVPDTTETDLKAAEAFLEANPELAAKVLKEMKPDA